MGWKYGWYYDTVEYNYYGATVTGMLYGSYESGSYGWNYLFSFTGQNSWGWGWHLDYGWEHEYFNGTGYYDVTITGYYADGSNSTYGTFEQQGRGTIEVSDQTSFSSWDYGYYYDIDSWFAGSFTTSYSEYSFSYEGDIVVTYQGWLYGWHWDSSYGAWYYDWWELFGWYYGWHYGFEWHYGWYYDHGWAYGWSYTIGWDYGWYYGW